MREKLFSRKSQCLGGVCCLLALVFPCPTFGFSSLHQAATTQYRSLLSNRRCRPHFMDSLLETEKEELSDNEGRINLVSMQGDAIASKGVEILSKDPLVYVVSNFLSLEECQSYQEYVQNFSHRNMTRSNPPDVSLDVSKLWPLLLLSPMASIPPVIHLAEEEQNVQISDVVQVAVPSIAAALATSGILAYGVVLPILRQMSKGSSRTSVAVALNTEADHDFVRTLVDKIEAFTKHPWTNWEAPVVTRYDPGAFFSRHGDASPIRGEEWKGKGGQRVVTCICYLNTLQEGGETYFDRLNIAVKPEAGKALFFFPADGVTWNADDRTTHESKPPSFEDKWIVQTFGRAQRVPPPLGLADIYRSTNYNSKEG